MTKDMTFITMKARTTVESGSKYYLQIQGSSTFSAFEQNTEIARIER